MEHMFASINQLRVHGSSHIDDLQAYLDTHTNEFQYQTDSTVANPILTLQEK